MALNFHRKILVTSPQLPPLPNPRMEPPVLLFEHLRRLFIFQAHNKAQLNCLLNRLVRCHSQPRLNWSLRANSICSSNFFLFRYFFSWLCYQHGSHQPSIVCIYSIIQCIHLTYFWWPYPFYFLCADSGTQSSLSLLVWENGEDWVEKGHLREGQENKI